MDRIFHQKWWDYSGQPLNIGGYVCLPFSLIWGVFCVFIVKCFQPLVAHLIGYIPHIAGIVILVILSIAMLADLYVTASAILKLNKRLEAMEKIAAEREKARRKRDEWEERRKEWDRKYHEQENSEICEMVHAQSLTPEQLAVIIQMAQAAVPNPENLKLDEKETEDME